MSTPALLIASAEAAALIIGAAAATAALVGRYRTLPALLTGPQICRLEAGGCQILFRTRTAALLGVPNAALGLALYTLLAAGMLARWPVAWRLAGASGALAMSIYLARYLLSRRLQCRICWAGHLANALLWTSLVAELLSGRR